MFLILYFIILSVKNYYLYLLLPPFFGISLIFTLFIYYNRLNFDWYLSNYILVFKILLDSSSCIFSKCQPFKDVCLKFSFRPSGAHMTKKISLFRSRWLLSIKHNFISSSTRFTSKLKIISSKPKFSQQILSNLGFSLLSHSWTST